MNLLGVKVKRSGEDLDPVIFGLPEQDLCNNGYILCIIYYMFYIL